jgi:hypothetical protein
MRLIPSTATKQTTKQKPLARGTQTCEEGCCWGSEKNMRLALQVLELTANQIPLLLLSCSTARMKSSYTNRTGTKKKQKPLLENLTGRRWEWWCKH